MRHEDRRRLLDRPAPVVGMFIDQVVAVSGRDGNEAVVVRGGVRWVRSHDGLASESGGESFESR